jgi:phosphatidylinositol glycan class K
VLAIGSSALGEPSWSFAQDQSVGLSLVDRFTHFALQFLERVGAASDATLAQLFATLDRAKLHSTAVPRTDLFKRRLRDVKITDFFGAQSAAFRPAPCGLAACADAAAQGL